jgi:hypothetical protein
MVEGLMVAAVDGIPSIGAPPPTLKFPSAGCGRSVSFGPMGRAQGRLVDVWGNRWRTKTRQMPLLMKAIA